MADQAPDERVRMTLAHDEYLSEHGGRLRAGTVVLVDPETATRWRERGIAVDSAKTDKTMREQKEAQLAALQKELEAIPDAADAAPVPPTPAERARGSRR